MTATCLNNNENVSKWFYEHFEGITKIEYTEENEVILYGENIVLIDYKLAELPYKIKEVHGNFLIGGDKFWAHGRSNINHLITLHNCPYVVYGKFYCGLCPDLTSLEGGPDIVHGSYECNNTGIQTLNGIAHTIKGDIMAYANKQLINIEALHNTEFHKIDLDLCVDFLYGSPIYKTLHESHKVMADININQNVLDLYKLKYKDVNQL